MGGVVAEDEAEKSGFILCLRSRKQFLNKKYEDHIQRKFLSTYNVPYMEVGGGAGDTKVNERCLFSGLKDTPERDKLVNCAEDVGRRGWMNGD